MKALFLFMLGLIFTTQNVLANDKIIAKVLIKDSVSWDGGYIQYPDETPEITVVKINVASGAKISLHCHTIPLAAYILKGAIEVIKSSGEKRIFKEGEAFIEVMNKWHKGVGVGKDNELIAFYAGQKNVPLSVKKDGDTALTNKCN